MKVRLWRYLYDSYLELPAWVYEGLLAVLCVGAVSAFLLYGARKGGWMTLRLLLVEFVVMIYCSTVFFRHAMKERDYDFHPFWSYAAIHEGREELLEENMMNILVFVPIGLLIGLTFRNIRWWVVLLIGTSISALIEILQFYTKLGFSELDDVMHNTAGCMIGYGICMAINRTRKWIARR